MKKFMLLTFLAAFLTVSFSSCRDQKTQEESLIEEMQDQGADIKVKDRGDTKEILKAKGCFVQHPFFYCMPRNCPFNSSIDSCNCLSRLLSDGSSTPKLILLFTIHNS